jgi:AraC-like DNA-binding protein
MTLAKIGFGDDGWVDCGARRKTYDLKLPQLGRLEVVHRGASAIVSRGTAAIVIPEGDAVVRWGRAQTVCVRIDRCAVDDALGAALGREVLSQIEFETTISTTTYEARVWTNMLATLVEQLFRSDGLLSHPLVTMPFVDFLVRGLLMVAEHPHRNALKQEAPRPAPQPIGTVIEPIEAEPALPWTVSTLAARGFVSVRSLQAGFRRYTGLSPMAYLRQVRLRHAHQDLLRSDPSIEMVTSVAARWGFNDLSRFGALHKARYRETPAVTLRRSARST